MLLMLSALASSNNETCLDLGEGHADGFDDVRPTLACGARLLKRFAVLI